MNKSAFSMLKWPVCIFLAIFLIYQVVNAFFDPFTTGTAIYYDTYEGIDINAVAIRNETILESSQSGIKSYTAADGERVSKNGVVAQIYSSASDAAAAAKIKVLQERIAVLKEVQSYNTAEAADINMLDSKLKNTYLNFISAADMGSVAALPESREEMLKLLNRRQIVTGEVSDYKSLIATLESEYAALQTGVSTSVSQIRSGLSGYFVSSVDGCEGQLKCNAALSMTPEKLEEITQNPQSVPTTATGKIVSDDEWYLAATVSMEEAVKLREEDAATLLTSLDSVPELPVTIKKITRAQSGDKAIVIFSCTYMNSELSKIRVQPMTIMLGRYSGLQINSKAIRFVDGVRGVFVLRGSVIKFVTVDVKHTADSFVICDMEKSQLKLYDEVVTKGRDIHDGKIIK